jgi:hypothetical protein
MVWLGGPRRRNVRGLSGGIFLNDPPPGYRPPQSTMPLKDRQRMARQNWILEHILGVILIISATAVLVIILVIIATHL